MTREIREFSKAVMAERASLGDASGKHNNKAVDWVGTVPCTPSAYVWLMHSHHPNKLNKGKAVRLLIKVIFFSRTYL